MSKQFQTIMVIGAGQMGAGIAQVAARAGLRVILGDLEDRFVLKGMAVIERNLDRDVEKGRLDKAERAAVMGRLRPTTDRALAAEADLVIEAVVENLEVKKALFADLEQICPPQTIFASNTSSLPITELAAATNRPERFIGMHFMNPVPVMKLVEIIRGHNTSDEVYAAVRDLAEQMGKTTVCVADYPAFVANRILLPMINEAIFTLYEGVASAEDIDTVMKLGMNHPMGPLQLADFIGLDTCLSVLEVLYDGFKDPKYRPCPLLVKMVRAGHYGRKSGQGFYKYT